MAAAPPVNPGEAAGSRVVNPVPTSSGTEGLPDWEPLTPELVEEEAIRGDFMIRWAVVLLALLWGCRQIVATTTLVHVKTGQYLSSHGIWPPATDVFSSTATEHRWMNLAWLWDLASAGLYSVGEGIGLSLATALLVAATWWLLGKTSRANVSTWWGSILGVLALLACHHHFSGQPETLTLLGLALTLWCLNTWRSTSGSEASGIRAMDAGRGGSLWWLVPGFVLWSNLDPRMFLGLVLLLLWGFGEVLGHWLGRAALTPAQRKHFWMVVGTSLVASVLNPFGVKSLLAPWVLYGTEYPAWRDYVVTTLTLEDVGAYSLNDSRLWQSGPWKLPLVAGVVVVLSGLLSLSLNYRRANGGDVVAFAGFSLLACVAFHELAAASVVACVLGTLNAQQWYQATFRQTYSTALSELLFTRGGRAVTVLCLFGLAVLSLNQTLFGADGHRVGMGLAPELRAMISAYRSATADSFDDRPYNFTHRQGDVLIWIDQKPFVDSRVAVFAGDGPANLLRLHDIVRRRLSGMSLPEDFAAPPMARTDTDDRDWRPILDRFQITHVLPRLVHARPVAYFRLFISPDWSLTHLGANCAVFYRKQVPFVDLKPYVEAHRLQFEKLAFQTDELPDLRTDWPRARTGVQKFLSPPQPQISNKVLEAENLLLHVQAMVAGQLSIERVTAVAMAQLAVRRANEGLTESIDHAAAYEVLGDAYAFLGRIETEIERESGVPFLNQLRFYQALGAYHQAALLQPNSLAIHAKLLELLQQHNRVDLMLRELEILDRLVPAARTDDEQDAAQGRLQLAENCRSQLDTLHEQLDKAPLDNEDAVTSVAEQVYAAGFVLEAIKLLQNDRGNARRSAEAHALLGVLRFEAGEIEEVYRQFDFDSESSPGNWRVPAAWARLAHAEYEKAIALWKSHSEANHRSSLNTVLASLPLIQSPFHVLGYHVWPIQHVQLVRDAQVRLENESTTLLWYTAMSQLEWGKPQLAAKTLKGLLEAYPETMLRPLVRFYLYGITDELIDPEPDSEWIPIEAEMFLTDETPDMDQR